MDVQIISYFDLYFLCDETWSAAVSEAVSSCYGQETGLFVVARLRGSFSRSNDSAGDITPNIQMLNRSH